MKIINHKYITGAVLPAAVAVACHYFYSNVPWVACWAIGWAMTYAWGIYDDLTKAKSELADLKNMFFIADTELIRVSALATDLEDQMNDLQRKVARAVDELDQIK